jgi:ABC-type multidrug transport system fused ATPase/permease subunit
LDQLNTKISIKTIFKEFTTRYPKQFFFLFLFLVIEGVTAALSMLAIIPLADFLLDQSMIKASRITIIVINIFNEISIPISFWSFGMLFVLLNLIKGILEVVVRYAILKIKYSVIYGLFNDTIDTFFKAKWGFFSSAENGVLLNTLNKELNVIGDTLGHLATLLAQIIQLCIFLSVPFLLNPRLTFTTLGISFLMGLPFLLLNKTSYKLGKKNTETANHAMAVLSELLQASRLILGFGKQNPSKQRYLDAFNKHVKVTLLSQTLSTAIPKFFQPLAMISVVIGISFALKANAPISEITAVMWSFLAALPILSALLQSNISINNFIPSYEQLLSLKNKAYHYREIEGELIFSKLKDNIELNNVTFIYPGRSNTLNNINLVLKKGEMTALIGESGSGKSTITDLLLGLQTPENGEVLIDGISLNKYKQNTFRQRVGYVPQDSMLFHCSVKENLLWSQESATDSELWDVLKLANADKFVKELPEGLDTLMGDRGVRLSGGQRQRIALARALIRKPDLLILDEATSSLDSESERLIQSSIENIAKDTTILIVAHRLSTIAKADQVYVLNKGIILEAGSFQELSNKNDGFLSNMLYMQTPQEINGKTSE